MSGAGTDAETYLRLAFERALAHSDQGQGLRSPVIAGEVLGAAGALDPAVVARIADDYAAYQNLRGGRRWPMGRSGAASSVPLPAARVAVLGVEVDPMRRLVVQRIALGADGVQVVATIDPGAGPSSTPSSPLSGSGSRMQGPAPPGPLTIADDHGTTATATVTTCLLNGQTWHATLTTSQPLRLGTSYVEIEGTRIDLPAPATAASARIETIGDRDPVRFPLDQYLVASAAGLGPDDSVEIAVDALAAVGMIDATGDVAAGARRMAETLRAGGPAAGLPEPWRAAMARRDHEDGPSFTMPLDVAVGPVGGIRFRFDYLLSEAGGLSVGLACSPVDALIPATPMGTTGASPVLWWADDDRGNTYLGLPAGSGGGPDVAHGTVAFLAPLDPEAKQFRLLPTTRDERAVVTIDLSDR